MLYNIYIKIKYKYHELPNAFYITIGYTIPKDTIIYPVLRYVLRDPDYWEKPNEFDPERFLRTGNDGKTSLIKDDRLVPFGIGMLLL